VAVRAQERADCATAATDPQPYEVFS